MGCEPEKPPALGVLALSTGADEGAEEASMKREIWYPERLIDSYLRECEKVSKREGWWSEEYFWLLVERGLQWRMEPVVQD